MFAQIFDGDSWWRQFPSWLLSVLCWLLLVLCAWCCSRVVVDAAGVVVVVVVLVVLVVLVVVAVVFAHAPRFDSRSILEPKTFQKAIFK